MKIEPCCAVCRHSFVVVSTRPVLGVVLHCGRESGQVAELAPRVQRWWACANVEREPGAEG